MPVTRLSLAATCLLAAACMSPDPPASHVQDSLPPIAAFSIESQIGVPAELDRAPRRPRLILHLPRGLSLDDDPIALVSGPANSALLDDLARAPFNAGDRARMQSIALGGTLRQLEVVPDAPLHPGAVYTLVLAGWARDLEGDLLFEEREGFAAELRISNAPEAGSAVIGFWPPSASAGVPPNLAAAVVRFDGALDEVREDNAWLEDADGVHVPAQLGAVPCAELDMPGHSCVVLTPHAELAGATDHWIVLAETLLDASGAPLGPQRSHFRTSAASDLQPPTWVIRPCEADAVALQVGCALVDDASATLHLAASEPVQLVAVGPGDEVQRTLSYDGIGHFRLDGLAPSTALPITLLARDLAGNEASAELSVTTEPPLPTLSISEVRADPLGPEPAQEYVEVWNYGANPIDLVGYSVTDDSQLEGTPLGQSAVLHADARALLVADAFDPSEPRDVPPPDGTLLVRVGGALGRSGLANAGEGVVLRDPTGRRISAAPARPAPKPGVCVVRVSRSLRDGSKDSFALDPRGTCTPGL